MVSPTKLISLCRIDSTHRTRFLLLLDWIPQCHITVDTTYHDSQFVHEWLLKFTNGKLDVKFNNIFPALIDGLKYEGRTHSEYAVNEIICILNMVKDE